MKRRLHIIMFFISIAIVSAFCTNESYEFVNAQKAFNQQQYDDALRYLNNCASKDATYYELKGSIFYRTFSADSAAYYLRESFLLGNKEDKLLIILGESLIWLGDLKSAEQILGMVKNSDDVAFLKVKASFYEKSKHFKNALKIYDRILSMVPDAFDVYAQKGLVLVWTNNLPEALSVYNNLISNPKISQIVRRHYVVKRAEIYGWKKDQSKADADLNSVLAEDSTNVEALLLKATFNTWQGNYEGAKRVYENILQIDPNNKDALYYLEKLAWVK